MVKFGRHLQFYLECEHDNAENSHYIVPYNQLRDDQIEGTGGSRYDPQASASIFEESWRNALHRARTDFDESMSSCWKDIFGAISKISHSRGASLEAALRLYVPTVGVTLSQDLLVFLKGLDAATTMNSEALRKLVKKFDKHGNAGDPGVTLSDVLLPELYCANFYLGQFTLEMAINTLRELLDDLGSEDSYGCDSSRDEEKKGDSVYSSKNTTIGSGRRSNWKALETEEEQQESITVIRRADEMSWLQDMIRRFPRDIIRHAVAHRGFHNPKDRSDLRPLENSLSAFEAAWSNGIHLCECDVALTKDEKIVLAHDDDFTRLALNPSSDNANVKISDLTFKELIALTLKNGVRAPLLLDVLRSASAIGPDAKLIIEIKPGNNQAAMALARLFGRNPSLMRHVAVIMSFDLFAMHELRGALHRTFVTDCLSRTPTLSSSFQDRSPYMRGSFDAADPTTLTIPKLMLLTVADPPIDHYELCVDVDDFSPIDGWLRTDDSVLDGVYIRFQSEMLESDGTAHLKALCNKYPVGVWGMNGKDPDDYKTMEFLVKECGVSFFNTDLPRGFLGQDDL